MPLLRKAQSGGAGRLLPHETVLDGDHVVRERRPVEQMAELVLEAVVPVVRHLQDAILDAKCVAEVDSRLGSGELRRPAVQAPSIEELDPLPLVRPSSMGEGGGEI
jgi:hypothetical protein